MRCVLTLNGGSSSIRFAFYDPAQVASPLLAGKVDRIGLAGTSEAADHRGAVALLMERLAAEPLFADLMGVGHRVVHGMQHSNPELVTPALLAQLKAIRPFDPEHLPREIELIETVQRLHPRLPQVACFDTAFHRTMPSVATLLPIPRRYAAKGVRRYGFHGLSYTFLMAALNRCGDPAATNGRVILAHLGNGASLAAVLDGRSIDTSMGFTPTSGVMMGSRSGDLDPGVVGFLAQTEAMTPAAFERMVTHESGLLGLSETSSDIRDLLARESTDSRAAEAVASFCYQVKKTIGAYAAALGGVDTLVFAGGIGENAVAVRARICAGMGHLGIELDEARNARGIGVISSELGKVAVRVIHTDEESVIAAATFGVLRSSEAERA